MEGKAIKKLDDRTIKRIGEVVGKKVTKGKRPDLSESRSVHTEPGDNRKYIQHSLRLADLPKCNMASAEEVTQRIKDYFAICADDEMKPSVAGLALAMDIDRTYLWAIRAGKRGQNPDVVDALKKAMKLLDLQMVDYMQNGKINPVSGIFLMKNNFGYADKQEVIVTPNSPLGDTKDTKELEARYVESVVEDVADDK